MLLNTKKEIDKFFLNGWTETPIQFEGTKFEDTDARRWISLQTIPYDRELKGFDGGTGRKITHYTEVVRCFAPNALKSFELAQQVLNFFECVRLGSIAVKTGIGDGNGAIDLENNLFQLSVNFDIIEY